MTTFLRESAVPLLIILAASMVVVFASLPLAEMQFADDMRAEYHAHPEFGDAYTPFNPLAWLGGILKVSVLMGIGALFTVIIYRIGKGISWLFNRKPKPETS